jgi:hypothetical protein
MSETRSRQSIRTIVFIALATFILVGPAYRQVFGGKNVLFRQWTMFSAAGSRYLDVRFSVRFPDGSEQPINYRDELGFSGQDKSKIPRKVWRVRKDGWQPLATQLCKRLGSDADLRLRSRVATPKGWRSFHDGSKNLCASLSPE